MPGGDGSLKMGRGGAYRTVSEDESEAKDDEPFDDQTCQLIGEDYAVEIRYCAQTTAQ